MSISKPIATILLLSILTVHIHAAPKSTLISYWNKSDESNSATIDHSQFDQFLKKNVQQKKELTVIDYQNVSQEDKALLEKYIKTMESQKIRSYNKKEQFAYWVNLYNALTIQVVLQHYPVQSITEIPNKILKTGPWDLELLTIENKKVSLNNIEHGILRPIWNDPRIHFLVNCASIGCPNIGTKSITGANSEEYMEQAARIFLSSKRAVNISQKSLFISSLFHWYGGDFGNSKEDSINYIKKYAGTKNLKILNSEYNKILYDYNWQLNTPENVELICKD